MTPHPRAIFAYYIGIGAYADPKHHLTAPRDDVGIMQELIETTAKRAKLSVCTHLLLDEEATREKVIDGFALFEDVTEHDVCVVYYSGHGSRIYAPYFLNQSSDLTESLVCQDSRTKGGLDLADKELAYLLDKYFQRKGSQVILVMDCCHAGANSRSMHVKDKMAEASQEERPIETFLGHAGYQLQETVLGPRLTVAPAPHLHMAACAAEETAKEMDFNGKSKSVFTHFLFESLTQSNRQITYAQLMSEVRLRAGQFVSFQTPEIQTVGLNPMEKHRLFLDGAWQAPTSNYYLFKDKKTGWCLNAGQVDGITENDGVVVENQPDKFPVIETMMQRSRIGNGWNLDPTQMYPCTIQRANTPKFSFATAEAVPTGLIDQIKANLERKPSEFWSYSDTAETASHLITLDDTHLVLIRKNDDEPEGDSAGLGLVRQKFEPTDLMRCADSLAVKLEQWSKFQHILHHRNPFSEIDLDAVELLVKVREAQDTGDFADALSKEIDQIIKLPQYMLQGRPHGSQMSLGIRNTSNIPLWASVQIMGPGWDPELDVSTSWSITNQFMQSECIPANESKYLTDYIDGTAYTSIHFYLAPDYVEQLGHEAEAFMHIWISTDAISTDRMNDLGLPIDTDFFRPSREDGKSLDPFEPDWQTFTIPLLIKNVNG